MPDRPKSVNGMDLLEFASFVADHARGHDDSCELHSDDVETLVHWAAKGLGVEPPMTPRQFAELVLNGKIDLQGRVIMEGGNEP